MWFDRQRSDKMRKEGGRSKGKYYTKKGEKGYSLRFLSASDLSLNRYAIFLNPIVFLLFPITSPQGCSPFPLVHLVLKLMPSFICPSPISIHKTRLSVTPNSQGKITQVKSGISLINYGIESGKAVPRPSNFITSLFFFSP